MASLGEILVQDGACTPEAILAAARNQVIFGGRLGTNLLELGAVTEEALSRALGRRHGVPSLWGDLRLDPRAIALMRRDLAARHDVVPYLAADKKVAVLCADPTDLAMIDDVAFATGRQVHAIVVPEARLWALLRGVYGLDRHLRGIDVGFARLAAGAAAAAGAAVLAAPGDDLMDEGAFQALYAQGPGADEILELTDVDEGGEAPAPPEPQSPVGFAAALRLLEGVADRDAIARTVLRYARSRFRRAVLLTVNGGAARGWAGLGDGLHPARVRAIHLPLGAPGIVDTVVRTRAHYLGPIPRTEANARLLEALGGGTPANVFVVPILALERVVNVFWADDGPGGLLETSELGELLILSTRIARSYAALVERAG